MFVTIKGSKIQPLKNGKVGKSAMPVTTTGIRYVTIPHVTISDERMEYIAQTYARAINTDFKIYYVVQDHKLSISINDVKDPLLTDMDTDINQNLVWTNTMTAQSHPSYVALFYNDHKVVSLQPKFSASTPTTMFISDVDDSSDTTYSQANFKSDFGYESFDWDDELKKIETMDHKMSNSFNFFVSR